MRVEMNDEQLPARLLRAAAVRSPAPSLRTDTRDVPGPQRTAASSRRESGGQTPRAARAALERITPEQPAGARIRMDRATNRVVTQVLNESNQVIRQIPPEELLRIMARFRELQGLLFDERT